MIDRSKLTPLTDWVNDSEVVALPSGRVVELRRPDVIELIGQDGEAPDMLGNLVLASIGGKGGSTEIDSLDKLRQMMASVNVVCKAAFVYPRLIEGDSTDGEAVPLGRVAFNDRAWVFGWVLGVRYQAAESFRAKQAGDVEPVPAVQDVPAATERGAGTRV